MPMFGPVVLEIACDICFTEHLFVIETCGLLHMRSYFIRLNVGHGHSDRSVVYK